MASTTTSLTTTTGQCLCGKVKVTVTDKPLICFPTLVCHCTSCKRRSGGIASYAFVVPKQHIQFHPEPNLPPTTAVAIITTAGGGGEFGSSGVGSSSKTGGVRIGPAGGVHKVFVDHDTGSGKPMQRTMCVECGSPVCIIEAESPDSRCLQFGLFAGVKVKKGMAVDGKEEGREVDLLDEVRPQLELFASRTVKWMAEIGEDVRETV